MTMEGAIPAASVPTPAALMKSLLEMSPCFLFFICPLLPDIYTKTVDGKNDDRFDTPPDFLAGHLLRLFSAAKGIRGDRFPHYNQTPCSLSTFGCWWANAVS